MTIDKEQEVTVKAAINDFIIPGIVLQIREDIKRKGGVSIPYLLSKPGAGKTSIVGQVCELMSWGMLTIQPALKPIEEYGGIPKFKTITFEDSQEKVLGTVWSIPDVMIELKNLSEKHEVVVFFWDDLHLCGPEHLALMQEFFTERSIRGYKIPDNVGIVLAGNQSNKAGYRSLSSAIVNRCVRLPVYAAFSDWKVDFAIQNGIHQSIISFLGHPMYSKFFHEEELVDMPWGSPRQWARLSNFLTAYEDGMKKPMPSNQVLYFATGHVGAEAASQYVRYFEIFTKFDIVKIFEDTKNFSVPDDELDRYIFVFACLNHIVGNYSKRNKEEMNKKIVDVVGKMFEADESLGLLLLKEIILQDSKRVKIDIASILKELKEKHDGIVQKVLDKRKEDD